MKAGLPVTRRPAAGLSRMELDPDRPQIEAAVAGSREAVQELYRRHADRVYNLMLQATGRREEASDLTQQTFLQAFTALKRFEFRSTFATWLTRIALNLGLEHRREAARPRARASESEALLEAQPSPATGPEDAVLAEERRDRVRSSIAGLSPKLREVVLLRYVEDLKYHEIAALLGVPEGTVKSRLGRAYETLVRELGRLARP